MIEWVTTVYGWIKGALGGGAGRLKEHGETILKNADLADEVVKLCEEKRQLEAQVKDLEARVTRGPELLYREPVYWAADESAANPGPFCPKCHTETDKAVPMYKDNGGFRCTSCNKWYPDPDAPPRERPSPRAPRNWATGY